MTAPTLPSTVADEPEPVASGARAIPPAREPARVAAVAAAAPPPLPSSPRRIAALVAAWLLVTAVGLAAAVYGLGPIVEQRDQRRLLATYRGEVRQAAFEAQGLPGVSVPTEAPAVGAPVAILEIGRLGLQQVVSEGVGAAQTRRGPGHVPGSAGPGQPGNTAIVGRRSAFGAPFRDLERLRPGDQILVSTTQGQSVYRVATVRTAPLAPDALEPTTVFGPAKDDRLTLVTSGSTRPGQTSRATVVVARMEGLPFTPTPQGGRTANDDGRHGDGGAWPAVVLALLAYAVVAAAAVFGYRRTRLRSAYLLSSPPLVACTVLLAEAMSRLLPAWT